MWVSREKFQELCRRVEYLERRRQYEFPGYIEVWSDADHERAARIAETFPNEVAYLPPGQQYSVKEVLKLLLVHCGLRLKYTPSSAPNLSLEKVSKRK